VSTPEFVVIIVKSAPPVTQAEEAATRKKLNDTGLWLAYEHPHFGLAWSRCKHKLTITRQVPTMAVDPEGAMKANPDFVKALAPRELAFVVCHELLHVAGVHYERAIAIGVCNEQGVVADPAKREAWGLGTDMAINYALVNDHVGEMPKGVHEGVMPPREYDGNKDAESIYVWLMKKAKSMSGGASASNVRKAAGCKGDGQHALQGCLPGPGEGEGEGQGTAAENGDGPASAGMADLGATIPLGDTIRAALAQGIGKGSAVAELLAPRPPRCRWETVLESGFTTASLEATNRIYKTYSRSGRRQGLMPGAIVPGRRGGMPTVALVIDVSGSMDRKAVAQILGEALDIARLVGAELYLAVHTEKLEWSGWVKPGDVETFRKATKFSGGTDAGPAYEAVRQARTEPFDCLVHFTDTYLPYWPQVPAKRLVVGATGLPTGANLGCQPPPGAKVLRVEV